MWAGNVLSWRMAYARIAVTHSLWQSMSRNIAYRKRFTGAHRANWADWFFVCQQQKQSTHRSIKKHSRLLGGRSAANFSRCALSPSLSLFSLPFVSPQKPPSPSMHLYSVPLTPSLLCHIKQNYVDNLARRHRHTDPLPSSRQHLSNDDCLKHKTEIIITVPCCVVYDSCAQWYACSLHVSSS